MKQPNEDLGGVNGSHVAIAAKQRPARKRRPARSAQWQIDQVTLNTVQGEAMQQEDRAVSRFTETTRHIRKRQGLHLNLTILLSLLALTGFAAAICFPIGALGWTKVAGIYIQAIAGLALGAGGGIAGYFARFFAQCYKADLVEEQNVSNELTNIESKYAALTYALALGKPESIDRALRTLSETERNILRHGQTTIELEKIKLAQKSEQKTGLLKRRTAKKRRTTVQAASSAHN